MNPSPDSPSPTHALAVEAWHAGLCVIPAHTDGSKRPRGRWKEYQTQRPTLEEVEEWFRDGHPGIGVLTGAISGNLEMVELEGRAVDAGYMAKVRKACAARGIADTLTRIANGYTEQTPSRGIHLLYHVDGAPVEGNQKLAMDPDRQVLIETRGEGGFVVIAPSHGPTHPTGKPWKLLRGGIATIATITADERQRLLDALRTFDETPTVTNVDTHNPPPANYTERDPFLGAATGGDWVAEVVARYNDEHTWDVVLVGWHRNHTDANGITYWTRPDKDPQQGWSATTNGKGTDRLIVFTSKADGFETYTGIGAAPSYDRFGAYAVLNHNGDRVAAARHLSGRTGTPRAGKAAAPPDYSRHLPDEFWQARPALTHIRQAAHSRARSADAFLAVTLARLSAFTQPSVHLPSIVGSPSSLAIFVSLVGASGAGKSTVVRAVCELLPSPSEDVADLMPLGSGEGLIELYFDFIDEEGPNGKKQRVKRQTRHGAFVFLDEGQALAELGGRKGSTLLTTLRTAWTGALLGNSNASVETKRKLDAGSYALGLVVGFQPTKAAELLADTAGGTPQRFEWVLNTDPHLPDVLPEWPGPLRWVHPAVNGYGISQMPTPIVVPTFITDPIRTYAAALTRGEVQPDEYNSHATLARLKVAGLLAVLDSRLDINADDWDLSAMFQSVSHRVRSEVLEYVALEARQSEERRTATYVNRETAVVDSQVARAVERMARSIARHVHRDACEGGCVRGCITRATAGRDRHSATIADGVEKAVSLRWITVDGEHFRPGSARPT